MKWIVFDLRTQEEIDQVEAGTRSEALEKAETKFGEDYMTRVGVRYPMFPAHTLPFELTQTEVEEAVRFWLQHGLGLPKVKTNTFFIKSEVEGEHDILSIRVESDDG
jgi:hypothetical protein